MSGKMEAKGVLGRLVDARRSNKIKKFAKRVGAAKEAFGKLSDGFGINGKELEYFAVLGIAPTDDQKTIKDAYRGMVKRYHPDISKNPDANAITKRANEAYAFLSKHAYVETHGEKSKAIMMNAAITSYSAQLDKDYETLKNSLSHGPVEKWFYMQEVENFLDYKKRSKIAIDKVFGDFYRLEKEVRSLHKEAAKMQKIHNNSIAGQAISEINYLFGACMRISKDIEEIRSELQKHARESSEALREKFPRY